MTTETKRDQLLEFIEELKANGFTVYAPKKITTYCNFVKEDQIGYVERGDFGFNFGTVHKPCPECGTGYSIHREIACPTVEMAQDCFMVAPRWASREDVKAVKKYRNWEEYKNLPVNRIVPKEEVTK